MRYPNSFFTEYTRAALIKAIAILIMFLGIMAIAFLFSPSPIAVAWLIGSLIGINLLFDRIWMLTLHSE